MPEIYPLEIVTKWSDGTETITVMDIPTPSDEVFPTGDTGTVA